MVELLCLPGVFGSSRHPLKKALGKQDKGGEKKGGDKRYREQGGEKRIKMGGWRWFLRTSSPRGHALHQQCACCLDINALLSPGQCGDGEMFEAFRMSLPAAAV